METRQGENKITLTPYCSASQHPELQRFMQYTGNRVLVEASPVDRVWGIGLAADNERARNPRLWRGQNLLGFVP
jgi:ribA/ribD-fused uncharacterized protein